MMNALTLHKNYFINLSNTFVSEIPKNYLFNTVPPISIIINFGINSKMSI